MGRMSEIKKIAFRAGKGGNPQICQRLIQELVDSNLFGFDEAKKIIEKQFSLGVYSQRHRR